MQDGNGKKIFYFCSAKNHPILSICNKILPTFASFGQILSVTDIRKRFNGFVRNSQMTKFLGSTKDKQHKCSCVVLYNIYITALRGVIVYLVQVFGHTSELINN